MAPPILGKGGRPATSRDPRIQALLTAGVEPSGLVLGLPIRGKGGRLASSRDPATQALLSAGILPGKPDRRTEAEVIRDQPAPINFDTMLRPNDERGFVHKKILGGIGAIAGILPIPGAGLVGAIARRLAGGGQRKVSFVPSNGLIQTLTPGDTRQPCGPGQVMVLGQCIGLQGGNGDRDQRCPAGTVWDPELRFCVSPESPFGAGRVGGDVMMGRFGPAVAPMEELRSVAQCPTGMALGKDGLCYDHIANRDRKYPRGRRPLLTGGEMRCISRASTAAKRLDRTNARLRGLGLMKPEAVRKRKTKKVC